MATPWWAKVSADYYKQPSNLAAQLAPRARHFAAVVNDTHLKDEPQVAAAYMNANIPFSIAQRTDREYTPIKAGAKAKLLDQAGMPSKVDRQTQKINAIERKQKELQSANYWSLDPTKLLSQAGQVASDSIDAFTDRSKQAANVLFKGANAIVSPIMNPVALARANEGSPTQKAVGEVAGQLTGIPVVDNLLGTVTKATGLGTVGAGQFTGAIPLSAGQQQDMRKQGFDPNSFGDRWSWYYDSMEPGQKAVADSDVAYYSQQYDPKNVQAMREILNSNVLNDGNRDAISPEANAFIDDVQSDQGNPANKELFDRMAKSSTLHPGSLIANVMGLERGKDAEQVVSALGDMAFLWYADPLAAAGRGLNAYRSVQRGVSAGSIASAENKLLALERPGDLTSPAANAAGKSFRDMIDKADQMIRLDNAAKNASTEAEFTANTMAANRLQQQFRLRHPDMQGQLTATAQILSGKLEAIAVKSDSRMQESMDRAAAGKEFNPLEYIYPNKPKATPFTLRRDANGVANPEDLNHLAYEMTKRMSAYVMAEAVASGRPIINGMVTLPGEVAVNRQFRAAVAPFRDWLIGTNKRFAQAMSETKGITQFDGTFDKVPDMFIGNSAGQWIKQNYNQKWTTGFERWAANLSKSASGKDMTFTRPESTELYTRFITPWMPKEISSLLARRWMTASPGERYGMWRQTIDSIEAAAGFKTNNPMVREFLDQLRKGISHEYDSAGRLMGPSQVYTAEAADNTIRAGGNDIAAAVWPWQLSESFRLPNIQPMKQMAQKTGVLSAVSGMFNSRAAMLPTSFWKVGKVGNSSNMMRQNMELWYMGGMEQGVKYLMDMGSMRRYVAGETIAGRVANNEIDRAANYIYKISDGQHIDDLNKLYRAGKSTEYVTMLNKIARDAGASPAIARILSNWNEGVWVGDMVNAGVTHKAGLALARPVDMLRKLRLKLPRTAPEHAVWDQHTNQEFIESQLKSALGDLGGSSSRGMFMLNGDAADDIANMAERGVGGVPARLTNARQLLGTGGDSGARNWFREFDSRQTDEFTQRVMQGVAMETLINRAGGTLPVLSAGRHATAADLINFHMASQGKLQLYPPSVQTAEDIAAYLIKHDPLGASMRNHSMRVFHNDDAAGSKVEGQVQQDMAYDRLAAAQYRDAARHLGAQHYGGTDVQGKAVIHEDYDDILRKVALGDRVTLDDLAGIAEDIRPKAISTPLYIPKLNNYNKGSIANAANKWYGFTVARPLMRLGITPAFLANRNVAYRAMAPAATELLDRGLSPTQVEGLLEYSASKYAVNATFRYTDEVAEHSYFSEMTDNFLMFQRAAEDFTKRFMQATSANPAVLSRSYLLTEAAQHSGLVYPHTERDEDGNQETHLVFTFPGSGAFAKAITEGGKAIGWGDSDLILKPIYSSMSSQLRFISPSLSNPLGFSTSPLIGMPLRIVRSLYPETYVPITNTLGRLEGGGERFFAEQNWWQSLLPTPVARLLPATPLANDDVDGQLASGVRNALAYGLAAGVLPDDDATADEKEEAHDALRGMVNNQLLWRAVIGSFSPWSPTYNEPEHGPDALALPDINPYDQARGLQSLKDEWFDVINTATEKYGDTAGLGEAFTEWYRRHPDGASIANPVALTVGSSHAPGGENQPTTGSGAKLSQWMMDNKDWILNNKAIAFYVLPEFSGDKQFTAQGFRDQLRNDLRVHKGTEEFYADARYAVATKEYYARLKVRGEELAGNSRDKQHVYDEWTDWEKSWRIAHPASAAEMDNRQNPAWVRGTLAPALQHLVEDKTVPAGVDKKLATEVWNHYSDYINKYNDTKEGDDGKYDRSHINKVFRDDGDQKFLGTPAEDLWKAMDIYEDGS